MTLYLASDHAGFELKQFLLEKLTDAGHPAVDMGPTEVISEDDYPDTVMPCVRKVVEDTACGIVIGGSGQGEGMAANRIQGARATVWYGGTLDIVRVSREHNDANILSLGARFITPEEAWSAVQMFIDTPFSGEERHVRRNQKLDNA